MAYCDSRVIWASREHSMLLSHEVLHTSRLVRMYRVDL